MQDAILKLRRLQKLEQGMVKNVIHWDPQELAKMVSDFVELKKEIQREYVAESALQITDKKAREKLESIFRGELSYGDKIIAILFGDREPAKHFFDDEEVYSIAEDCLYSWFGPHGYVEDLLEIGHVIIEYYVPDMLRQFVLEARSCFAFQQYLAVCALSRTILEISLIDLAMKTRVIPRTTSEDEGFTRLKKAKIALKYPLAGPYKELYADLSIVVHGESSPSKQVAKSKPEQGPQHR